MYLRALGRPATRAECRRCLEFVEGQADGPAAWVDLAHVLFNTKEFIFLH